MTLDEILSYPIEGKNILIIGGPGTGKTYLAAHLPDSSHEVVHTDDFISYGYEKSLYALMDKLQNYSEKTIIEGVIGYRLLRKGLELYNYFADVVIECEAPASKIAEIYKTERDLTKLKYLKTFNASHTKILNQFLADCPKEKQPVFLHWDNKY